MTDYNDWKNWDTWNANLWLNNDEVSYKILQGLTSARQVRAFFEDHYETNDTETGYIDGIDPDKVDWAEIYQPIEEEREEEEEKEWLEEVKSLLEDEQPEWCGDLSFEELKSIAIVGCQSSLYMHVGDFEKAKDVMEDYGDEVLNYLQEYDMGVKSLKNDIDWDRIPHELLVMAIDLWCGSFVSQHEIKQLKVIG